MSRINGFTLYEGPSMLDGKPIVCIATLRSTNEKTGDMIQTWIIPADTKPTEMYHNHEVQRSVCGVCPLQHSLEGGCYVNLGQAVGQVYKSYKAGKYPKLEPIHLHYFMGRKLRMGSFGDPAAVPYELWLGLTAIASGHTGYTHQASHPAFDERLARICMISSETPKQAEKYQAKGWKTFRVRTQDSQLMAGEIECFADAANTKCATCGLCNGKESINVAVKVHGSTAGTFVKRYSSAQIIASA